MQGKSITFLDDAKITCEGTNRHKFTLFMHGENTFFRKLLSLPPEIQLNIYKVILLDNLILVLYFERVGG